MTEGVERRRSAAAAIDDGRRAALSGKRTRLDRARRDAEEDVRVEVDQPGGDDEVAGIDRLRGGARGELPGDGGDKPVADADVAPSVDPWAGSMTVPPRMTRSKRLE